MITTILYMIAGVIALWCIVGFFIILHYMTTEYKDSSELKTNLLMALLFCWFGCFIPILNFSEKLWFWRSKNKIYK